MLRMTEPYVPRVSRACSRIRLHHMDLYRLRRGFDRRMLDMPRVLETSVCLIEWPDRLGAAQPANRLGDKLRALAGLVFDKGTKGGIVVLHEWRSIIIWNEPMILVCCVHEMQGE